MKTFKEFLPEKKFDAKKALRSGSINKKHIVKIDELEAMGWIIADSLDFIITGDGFELTMTDKKSKQKKKFTSNADNKPITDVLDQALKELK